MNEMFKSFSRNVFVPFLLILTLLLVGCQRDDVIVLDDFDGWDDSVIPVLSARVPTANAPTLMAFRNTTYLYAFANAVAGNENEVYGSLQMSHSYKLNSPIDCHIHFACGTRSGNNVTWAIEYTLADTNESFPVTNTLRTTGSCQDYYIHKKSVFGVIGNFSDLSGIAIFRLYRDSTDPSDTYAGDDAFALSFDCHFEKDSIGSTLEYVK